MNLNKCRSIALVICGLCAISCATDTGTYMRKGGDHLKLSDDSGELFWFSGIHSNDPKNIMFGDIEKKFLEFMPDLVLVEGGVERNIRETRIDNILNGESAFTAYLARTQNIECMSIEPPDSYLGEKISEKYTIDDILAMIAIRQIQQWQREYRDREFDFEDTIVGFMRNSSERMFIGAEFEASIGRIQGITERYVGFKADNGNWRKVPAYKIIRENTTIIHPIWADTIALRNRYLVELIGEKKKTYKKIFVTMGFDHATETEKELRALYSR